MDGCVGGDKAGGASGVGIGMYQVLALRGKMQAERIEPGTFKDLQLINCSISSI